MGHIVRLNPHNKIGLSALYNKVSCNPVDHCGAPWEVVRVREPDQLDAWLERAASSVLDAFERFAKRKWLREDDDSSQGGCRPAVGHARSKGISIG